MSKYNVVSENQKYFKRGNLEALPIVIRNEFMHLYDAYELKYYLLFGHDKYAVHIQTFKSLIELVNKDSLYIELSDGVINEKVEYVRSYFDKVETYNSIYKFKNEEYFESYFVEKYCAGFVEGYNSIESPNNIAECYNLLGICLDKNSLVDKSEDLFDENFDVSVLHPHYLSLFGVDEGQFIRAWEIVLDNPNKFKSLFEDRYDEKNKLSDVKENQIQWQGGQTELVELIKALIENGTLKGVQKQNIEIISKFFNVEIKYPNKLITDIQKRNIGSETLFLDGLKASLYNYITKENKR